MRVAGNKDTCRGRVWGTWDPDGSGCSEIVTEVARVSAVWLTLRQEATGGTYVGFEAPDPRLNPCRRLAYYAARFLEFVG